MRAAFVLLVLFVGTSICATLDARWKLIWSDEFTGSSLDQTKWTARTQPGLSGNAEQEYYLPSLVSVSNGSLVLTSTNNAYAGYPYSSGWVDSSSKFHSTFGRYEIRAKLPFGKGLWPAHWLLSEYVCWPKGAEIDIMENLGHQNSTVYGTYHFGTCCGCNTGNGSSLKFPADLSRDFHTYAVEWFPNNITWFVDDTAYHVVKDTTVNGGKPFPFDRTPHYVILNTAVGGTWPGSPDNTTRFPQYHYIDYVRVYAWQPCATQCSNNGCCASKTQTCRCNSGYEGSSCEYLVSAPFSTDFTTYNSAVETLTNPNNAVISNGFLSLKVDNTSCPSGCNGAPYLGGTWSTVNGYGFGNFTIRMKASGSAGTGTLIWGMSTSSSSFEAFQVTVSGSNPQYMQVQYWVSGASTWVGQYPLGFDASQAFHDYSIIYAASSLTFYADNRQIVKTTSAPASALALKLDLQYSSQWYGPINYKGPIYALADSASWSLSKTAPPANCTGL